MPTALSPIKSKRLDEKSTLQFLNGRLELYVLRVKEMEDAKNVAERELETIRQRMQADIDALRLRMSKELEETRKKLDIELDQKARLQVLEQEQHVELVKLRAQVKELSEIKALAESLQVELTKERSNSKSSKETLSVQTTQLQAARRRIKDLERENRSHEASLSDATKELEDLRKKSSDFDLTRDVEITSIRKEMNLKHQEALALWKKDTEERLHGVEKEVRHYFEGVVQGFKSQVEDLSLELDSTKKELDRTAIDYEESLQVRQSLTEKVAHLEREYREERTKFKEDRKKYESTLEHFRATKFAKEQEFNDLMDVKIALDAEITTYRRILDREETRVGLPTPTNTPNAKQTPRKRKSETGAAAAAAKRAKRAPSSVQIVHLDLEKDRIVLENSSDKPVSLAGWEVRGRSENQVFRFPGTYSMRPQSKMTVYSSKRNKNAKDERKPNEDSFLATKFSLNASGDFAVLLTAEGVPVSTRAEGLSAEEVKSLEAEIKAELDDDAPPAEGTQERCSIRVSVAECIRCLCKSTQQQQQQSPPAPSLHARSEQLLTLVDESLPSPFDQPDFLLRPSSCNLILFGVWIGHSQLETPVCFRLLPNMDTLPNGSAMEQQAAFECQPGYAIDRELLPEIEAAVTFVQDELAQIRLGDKDHCLQELIEGPPLPGDKFQTLLSIWKVPAIPAELAEMFKRLQEVQRREQEDGKPQEEVKKDEAETGDDETGDDADDEKKDDEAKAGATSPTLAAEQPKKRRGRKPRAQTTTTKLEESAEEAQEESFVEKDATVASVDDEDTKEDRGGNDGVAAQDQSEESMEGLSTGDDAAADAPSSVDEDVEMESSAPSRLSKDAAEHEGKSEEVGIENATNHEPEGDAEAALASLKSLRKSMLLDVLSKITSVAKSKGVDPAMFSSRRSKDGKTDFMDLATISSDVHSGMISEWEVFAHQVYLFCQHVIADSEKRDQQEAKQKGVELLHFARTLTETLRKASVKKEESLLQQMESRTSSSAAASSPQRSADAMAVVSNDDDDSNNGEDEAKEEGDAAEENATGADSKQAKTPPAHPQVSPKRPSAVDPLTPNRISARIRQRGNSFGDVTSFQGHTPRNDDGDAESKNRKRPRASSNASASSATATPPPAVNTASDDNMSESESQISASEAESKQRSSNRSKGSASPASSSAQTTPVKRTRTRKRRPVLPATRVSSRQQKRRAQKAAAGGDDDAKDGSDGNNNNNDGEDTAEGDDDDNKSETAETEATPPPAPVLLTKAGRPRKKPGRKPAGWKKTEGK